MDLPNLKLLSAGTYSTLKNYFSITLVVPTVDLQDCLEFSNCSGFDENTSSKIKKNSLPPESLWKFSVPPFS